MNFTLRAEDKINIPYVKYSLAIFVFVISFNAFAITPLEQSIHFDNAMIQDSLILKKNNSKREFVLKKERKIRVFVGKEGESGRFIEMKNDSLSMDQTGTVLKYHINDISRIKVSGGDARNILGLGLKIWGSLVCGAGFVPIFSAGAPGLLIAVPAWAVGYGIFKVGDLASGNRKFNLRKKWEII